jgi:hypothetical protein
MRRVYAVAAAVTFTSLIIASPMRAAPPTVTPSPGYDARLQEERAARSAVPDRIVPTSPSKSRPGLKRQRHRPH